MVEYLPPNQKIAGSIPRRPALVGSSVGGHSVAVNILTCQAIDRGFESHCPCYSYIQGENSEAD